MALIPSRKIAWAAALAGTGLALGAAYRLLDQRVSLQLDLEVDRGTVVEVFYNDLWTSSLQLQLTPGRHTYRFDGLPRRLWDLRFDPTNMAAAQIRLHAITFLEGGREVQRLRPSDWGSCQLINATRIPAVDGTLALTSTSEDPIVFCHDRYDFTRGQVLVQSAMDVLTPARLWMLFAALLIAASGWLGRPVAGQLPAVVLLAISLAGILARRIGLTLGGAPDARLAVGWANYTGYPKSSEFRLFLLSLVWTTGAALLFGGWARRRRPEQLAEAQLRSRPAPWKICLLSACVLLAVLTDAPALEPALQAFRTAVHQPSYDWMNVFTWHWCVTKGWAPLRDFWYPYGGFYAWKFTFPGGFLEAPLHELLLLATLGLAAYRLGRRSLPLATVALLTAILGTWGGFFAAPERYLLALDGVLLGLVAMQESQRRWTALFGAFAAYAFAMEPNQLGYAGVALAGSAAADFLWPLQGRTRGDTLRRGLPVAAAAAAGVMSVLLVLALEGRLRGELAFFSQMGPMAVYGSLQAALPEWFRFLPQSTNVLLRGALFLTAFGAGLHLIASGSEERQAAAVALATGLLAALTMNKEIMRQGIANQMTIYVAVGGAMTLWLLRGAVSRGQRAVLLLGAGFALTAGWHPEELLTIAREKAARISLFPGDLRLLAHSEEFRAAQASYFDDESRYPGFLPLIRRLKQVTDWKADRGPAQPFYVLGDDSALYVALGQKPPWYLTFYNESPIDAQEEVVRWLRSTQPEFVVWNPADKEFDGVPNLVRAPLVFEEVIAGYLPFESVGGFDILRRRRNSAPPALDYWKEKLGRTLDLRALPAHSGLSPVRACTKAVGCAEVLHIAASSSGQVIAVPVRAAGDSFEIRFTTQPGVTDYLIDLQHVWFWGGLARLGYHPALAAQAVSGAVRLEQVNPDMALY